MDSLFPQVDIPSEKIITTENGIKHYGDSLKFDFIAGDFDIKNGKPVIVAKLDALKQRLEKTLRTGADKYPIYAQDSEAYGTDFPDTSDKTIPTEFIEAEFEREITEVLKRDNEVTAVSGFSFSYEARTIIVAFNIDTVYGNTNLQLSL